MTGRILALTVLLAACGAPPASPDRAAAARIPVAVSVAPQATFVERIGGGRVRVDVMIPPGASEEDYAPSPRQMAELSSARLYVAVGHPAFAVESRYIRPFLARSPGVRVIDMSRGMRTVPGDPHVWVAPETVRVAAVNIAVALEQADPGSAADYRANLRGFLAEIDALDRDIRSRLGPPGERPVPKLMVYHPSWGYFARQYGLEQIAIEAEGKEPSAQRMIQLIDHARGEGVKLIFVQGGFPRKSAQVIADALGGRVLTGDPQDRDWAGNLRRVTAALDEAYR